MKLSEQKFLDAGYKRWNSGYLTHADYLLQKKIIDDSGVRYFIGVYAYVNKGKPYFREGIDKDINFQPEVQFSEGNHKTMNVSLLVDDMTDVQEIEDTFNTLWESVGKPYYEKSKE